MRRIFASLGWLLMACFAAFAPAQSEESARPGTRPEARLDSPRSTMFAFLEGIHSVKSGDEESWDEVLACFDFEAAGVDPQSDEAREIARDLWSALNRIRMVQRSDLPDAEAAEGKRSFRYFPRLFDTEDERVRMRAGIESERIELVRSQDGAWRFSARTVSSAPSLSRALSKLELVVDPEQLARHDDSLVRRWVPASLRNVAFLEVEAWQWIGLAVIALLGFLVDFLMRPVLANALRMGLRRYQNVVTKDTQTQFVRAAGLLAAGVVWTVTVRTLALPLTAENVLIAAARTFSILAGAWCAWRLADVVGEALLHAASKTASKFDDVIVPLVRKSAKILATVFAIIYGAQSLDLDVMPLITGLGIGGLAFAFAAKDTIENFFGSVAVVLDRPFEVGDWVIIDDIEGNIEELGFRSTRVRTFYNSQITIPNSTLVRATVDNYGRRRFRRWKTKLGVQYDTTPEQLLAFTEGLRELVRSHPYTRKDYYQIWCNDFGASSLDILLYVFFESPDWSTELRERERLFLDIVRLADQLGVQFAFPTQTLHVFQEEHGEAQVRHEQPATSTDRRARVRGMRAARDVVQSQPWRKDKPAPVDFGAPVGDLEGGDRNDPTRTTEDTRAS